MKTKILLTLSLFFTLITLSACGSHAPQTSAQPASVAIVAGLTANSTPIDLTNLPEDAQNIINHPATTHGSISGIISDGQPQIVASHDFSQDNNPENQLRGFLNDFSTDAAQHTEVNTFAAISMANSTLASGSTQAKRYIEIFSDGLDTTGYLNFTKGYLNAEPLALAKWMASQHVLDTNALKGVHIDWYYIGQTDGTNQKQLTPNQVNSLKEIWTDVLEQFGGKVVFHQGTPPAATSLMSGLPHVTPVSVAPIPTYSFNAQNTAQATSFPDSTLPFVANQAVFLNPNQAKQTLAPVANALKATANYKALICGTIASDPDNLYPNLSLERAELVASTLHTLGVSQSQLSAVGLGWHDIWHINDLDAAGNLIENLAAQNRKVVILNSNSPEGQEILAATK